MIRAMTDPTSSIDLAANFAQDGFVAVRNVLSAEEIARFGAAVDHAVATRKQHDTRSLAEKSAYEQSFIQCQYIWEDFPDIRPLTFHPRIAAIAAQLLQADCVRLWHDQALYKEALGRETEAHQDHPYWPIAEPDALTAWIPLIDIDETTGCMGYVPSTHHGPCEFIDIFNSPGAGKLLEARHAGANPPQFMPCRAGDVIFHHGRTVHMATANRSDRTRRVYTAIYFRDGCTRSAGRAHPSVDRDGIAVGEAIRGAATPVAWPLPQDRMPEPAPWPQSSHPRAELSRRLGIIPGASQE